MDNPEILVVSGNHNIRRRITLCMASIRGKTECCPMDREVVKRHLARGPNICIIDSEEEKQAVLWLLDTLSASHEDVSALLIVNDHDHAFIQDLLSRRTLNNLIARRGGMSTTGDIIDENELIVTCQKLLHRDIFGIEKYLPSWGVEIHERRIRRSTDKDGLLSELRSFLADIECSLPIRYLVCLAADELITNSIFKAPRDAAGAPKYAGADRRMPLTLEPYEEVCVHYACDGRHVALSVTDRFGSLDRDVIVQYLNHCYSGQPRDVDSLEEAGIGLYMVFSSISQLTFNIEVGVSTEVIALFYIRGGARVFRASGRSLNIFLQKPTRKRLA